MYGRGLDFAVHPPAPASRYGFGGGKAMGGGPLGNAAEHEKDCLMPKAREPEVHVHDVSKLRGQLKSIGGSMSDDWNNILADQTVQALWFFENSDAEEIRRQRHAAVDALIGIKPRDELEGMIAAQLIAAHNASMECYRRAMIRDQTFEGRREALSQANKHYATLLDTLNRHRGKGQQKVTVEHVHVHEGGQAIVGNVESRGRVCIKSTVITRPWRRRSSARARQQASDRAPPMS